MSRKRSWFEVKPGQHKPKLLRNGAIFAIFLTLSVYIMYFRPPLPVFGSKGEEITAIMGEATNIRPGFTPVRVSGIKVGQVTKLDNLGPRQGFEITMELTEGEDVGTIRQDASAVARWRTLLGRNVYIDLRPGSPSAPELNGPIPRRRTGGQIEVDEAIDSFDARGRASVGTIIEQFDKGFANPGAVRGAVREVAPTMRNVAPALSGLQGTEAGDLPKAVLQTSRAMGALARDEQALGGLVDNGAVALGVTAVRRADIGATLQGAPAALRQTAGTAVRLRTTLDELDPLAAELRPGARALDATAVQTQTLLDRAVPLLADARPTLRDLAPALRSARIAARTGTPALQGLQPVLDRLQNTLTPWFGERHAESKRKNFQMIGPTLGSVASLMSVGDSRGALARFQAGAGEGAPGVSPCSTRIFDGYTAPADKIKCELLVSVVESGLSGRLPLARRFTDRAVPNDLLDRVLTGKLPLGAATAQLQDTVDKVQLSKRGGR